MFLAATLLITSVHIGQSLVSLYGLAVSYFSITNLQKYEEKSEKAAKYSGTAEHQLHKTRTTQASGALSILASLLLSFILATVSFTKVTTVVLNLAMAGIAVAAHMHVKDFWHAKAKVPFVDGYNEGISRSQEIIKILALLSGSWGVTAILGLIF
ncbi:hypothetical protein MBLNU457_6270t1 [Dothideomycetes sp. NU457]